MLGSLVGAALLLLATNGDSGDTLTGRDFTGGLGSNGVNARYSLGNCFVGECIMTFLLVYVVFETAVNKKAVAENNAPIAIGLAVFLAHMSLIPQTGCSINPTRSFGPAVVAYANGNENVFDDHWLFWVAPLFGAALAVAVRGRHIVQQVNKKKDDEYTVEMAKVEQSLEYANNDRAYDTSGGGSSGEYKNQRAFDPGAN
jgi:glycerol uptake facilitator-like aquaporin